MADLDHALLVRATPNMLEGWCGPVVVLDHEGWCEVPLAGVVLRTAGNAVTCWLHYDGVPCERLEVVDIVHVRLDASRAEVRDRLARVLAMMAPKHAPMCTAPDWMRTTKWRAGPGGLGCVPDGGYWTLWTGVVNERHDVADLDPHDDTLLPDGSRRVDALALVAVVNALQETP